MECTFVVGQKVVCVRDVKPKHVSKTTPPQKGEIYTIRGLTYGTSDSGDQAVGVYLVEIVNPLVDTTDGKMEVSFYYGCFRPLTTLEQKVANRVSLLKGITKDTVIRDDGMQNTKTPSKRRKRIVVEEYQ